MKYMIYAKRLLFILAVGIAVHCLVLAGGVLGQSISSKTTVLPNVTPEFQINDFSITQDREAVFAGWVRDDGGFLVTMDLNACRVSRTQKSIDHAYFLDVEEGWVSMGGKLYATSDGGATITPLGVPTGGRNFFFIDKTLGWMVDREGHLLRIDGRGARDLSNGIGRMLKFQFLTDKVGFAIVLEKGKNRELVRTVDGGETWVLVKASERTMEDFYFVDERTGWVETDGYLYATLDGGQTFVKANSLNDENISRIFFLNSQVGWVYSLDGKVYRTVNGGRSWKCSSVPANGYSEQIAFADSMNGWISVRTAVYRSFDGGATWNDITPELRSVIMNFGAERRENR